MNKFLLGLTMCAALINPAWADNSENNAADSANGGRLLAQQDMIYIDTSSWTQINIGGCDISFPEKPRTSDIGSQGVSGRAWECELGEPLHIFKITKLEVTGISHQDTDEVLFKMISDTCNNLGGRAVSKKRLENQRNPGCMFKIMANDGEWDFMIRLDRDTVYTLSVCSMPGEAEDGYKDAFFRSFLIK